MGSYVEYLGQPLANDIAALTAERKKQLRAISDARGGRDILVFAADLNKDVPVIAIGYVDILPITDQISNLNGKALDLILETPGGSGEAAEDIVRLLREKYDDIAVIIPGWAKSAGTIMAMAANEILMGPASALGPIDAQMVWQSKRFSADALLEGMEKIKKEVVDTGILNKAYIPILQGISPGELQSAENALNFTKTLVTQWLAQYKFKNWTIHSSTKAAVTEADKKDRAKEIADQLCDHRHWLTHGRSIKLADLKKMRLLVEDYSQNPKLLDAISRYFALLQMSFAGNIYKMYETPASQIMKAIAVQQMVQQLAPQAADGVVLEITCNNCKTPSKVQVNLGTPKPIQPGHVAFPANSRLKCPKCGIEHDLTNTRRQIEAQFKKPIV
jgi:ClpP class serine protease